MSGDNPMIKREKLSNTSVYAVENFVQETIL